MKFQKQSESKSRDLIGRPVITRKERIESAVLIFLILGHLALIGLGAWAYFKIKYIEQIIGI